MEAMGRRIVWIVAVEPGGAWQAATGDNAEREESPDGAMLLGFVLVRAWRLATMDTESDDVYHSRMRTVVQGQAQATVSGYIEYPVIQCAELLEPPEVLLGQPPTASRYADMGVRIRADGRTLEETTVSVVFARWRHVNAAPQTVLELAPCYARHVVAGRCAVLHVVAVTSRVNRRRCLFEREPPQAVLAAFLRYSRGRDDAVDRSRLRRRKLPSWFFIMTAPDLVVDWLDATSHLKQIKNREAAEAFSRVLARASGIPRAAIMRGSDRAPDEKLLRVSRIRLDCVAMLTFRAYWTQMREVLGNNLHVYIYCDDSPTLSGAELFASTIEVFDGVAVTRKLLPVVSLPPGFCLFAIF